MARQQSSQRDGKVPAESAAVPLIDMAALGERLLRLRQWKRYSQATLAQRAGVDGMVISRLERQQKPRLEIETAAKLARVFTWTLDQFCGLAEAPAMPVVAPVRRYTPLDDGMPAWLDGEPKNRTEMLRLAASIMTWHARGATYKVIAESLNTWGIPTRGGKGRWTPDAVSFYSGQHGPHRRGKKALRDFLQTYGPAAETPPRAPVPMR
jgi:transcriptional regulator with XRE-family HTH domain